MPSWVSASWHVHAPCVLLHMPYALGLAHQELSVTACAQAALLLQRMEAAQAAEEQVEADIRRTSGEAIQTRPNAMVSACF